MINNMCVKLTKTDPMISIIHFLYYFCRNIILFLRSNKISSVVCVSFRQRPVKDFIHQGQIIFLRGVGLKRTGRAKKTAPPPKKIPTLGHNTQEGGWAEYLTITKERLFLASAPYAPHEKNFFHQRQKLTISKFIKGI